MRDQDKGLRLVGTEDGEVLVLCERDACMVPVERRYAMERRRVWWSQRLPYQATPSDVLQVWTEHARSHLP